MQRIKKFFEENPIGNFVSRYGLTLGMIAVASILFGVTDAEIKTFFLIIATEMLAILLSGFAVFAYTKIRFTSNIITKKKDGNPFSPSERAARIGVLGSVVISVHILVAVCIFSIYMAQFAS